MDKVRVFLRLRWKWLAGLVLVVAVAIVGVLLLMGNDRDFSRYQAMLDRGEVSACRDGLYRQLKRDPDWDEGRAFLAQVEMEEGELGSAVSHLICLAARDVNIQVLEDKLLSLLSKLPEPNQEIIAALTEGEWPLAFSLRYALALNDLKFVCSAYRTLMETYPEHQFLKETWQSLLSKKQLASAWSVAEIRGAGIEDVILAFYALQKQSTVSLDKELLQLDKEGTELHSFMLPELLKLEAEGYSPVSTTTYAQAKLNVLMDYSQSNQIQAAQVRRIGVDDLRTFMGDIWLFGNFDEQKFHLADQVLSFLAEGGSESAAAKEYRDELYVNLPPVNFSAGQMDNIDPELLWERACWWFHYDYHLEGARDCIQTILEYLKNKSGWERNASYFETVLNPPDASVSPTQTIDAKTLWPDENEVWISNSALSPDGRFLYISAIEPQAEEGWSKQDVIDLESGKQVALSFPAIDSYSEKKPAAWSRDSNHLALKTAKNTIAVYIFPQGKLFAEIKLENTKAELNMLGWSAEGKLVWAEVTGKTYQVVSYDLATEKKEKIGGSTEAVPAITPSGKLAYLDGVGEYGGLAETLKVTIDDNTRTYQIPDGMRLVGWLPEDVGLHLSAGVLDFNSGKVKKFDVLLDLFRPFPDGWKNSYQVYGISTLGYAEDGWGHHEVMLLDIRDMSLGHVGFYYEYGRGGRVVIDSSEEKVKIYKLW